MPQKDPKPPGGWLYAKRPVLMFVVLFVVFLGLFYGVTFLEVIGGRLIPAYTRLNAQVSAVMLNWFDEGAKAEGTQIFSPRYQVDIKHGCDAVAPSILFISAVLAFPASLKAKLPGMLIGTVVLGVINLVRIVSLFYTGVFYPHAFEIMHVDVWQPVFILLSLLFWVLWAWRVTQRVPSLHASMAKN